MKNMLLLLFLLLLAGKNLFAQPLQTLYYSTGEKYMEGHWTFTKQNLLLWDRGLIDRDQTEMQPQGNPTNHIYQRDAGEVLAQAFNVGGRMRDPAQFLHLVCDGPVTYFTAAGHKQMEIGYKRGVPHGRFTEYYNDIDKVLQQGTLVEGMPDGPWTYYHKNGQPFYTGTYKAYSQAELETQMWTRAYRINAGVSDFDGFMEATFWPPILVGATVYVNPFLKFHNTLVQYAQKEGRFQFWNDSGAPWAELNFVADLPNGIWKLWEKPGQEPATLLEWKQGNLLSVTPAGGKKQSREDLNAEMMDLLQKNYGEGASRPNGAPASGAPKPVISKYQEAYAQPIPPGDVNYRAPSKTEASTGALPKNVFNYVEEMPKFSGDLKAWLAQNSRYPLAPTGNAVTVELIVLMDGTLVAPEIKKSSGTAAQSAEALRLVKAMPNWIPGRQNKQLVTVRTQLVIKFAP